MKPAWFALAKLLKSSSEVLGCPLRGMDIDIDIDADVDTHADVDIDVDVDIRVGIFKLALV